MRRSIARIGHGQNKGFKKPTRVCQMPLRRAHIRHGLNDVIFRHQRLAEPVGKPSHLMVPPDNGLLVGSLTETVEDSRAMNTVIDGHIPLLFHSTSGLLYRDANPGFSSPQPRDSRMRSTNSPKLSMTWSGAHCNSA